MNALLTKLLNAAAAYENRAKTHDELFDRHAPALLGLIRDGYMDRFNNRGLFTFCMIEIERSDYGKHAKIRFGACEKPGPGAADASVSLTLHGHDMAEQVATLGLRGAARHYTNIICKYAQRQLDCPRGPV